MNLMHDLDQVGRNQIFEVFAHIGYGLLVVPFVIRFAAARGAAQPAAPARPLAP